MLAVLDELYAASSTNCLRSVCWLAFVSCSCHIPCHYLLLNNIMVWKYTSTVIVAGTTNSCSLISLWQFWRVWSNIPDMPLWDRDCESARLDTTMEEGRILFIAMKNKPTNENKCIFSKLMPPNSSSPSQTKFHFVFSVPLAELSFQYEAAIVEGSNDICLTHSTVITGLMAGMYGYLFKDTITSGCDHMSKSVPALAMTMLGT